jgi:hypothetical protein
MEMAETQSCGITRAGDVCTNKIGFDQAYLGACWAYSWYNYLQFGQRIQAIMPAAALVDNLLRFAQIPICPIGQTSPDCYDPSTDDQFLQRQTAYMEAITNAQSEPHDKQMKKKLLMAENAMISFIESKMMWTKKILADSKVNIWFRSWGQHVDGRVVTRRTKVTPTTRMAMRGIPEQCATEGAYTLQALPYEFLMRNIPLSDIGFIPEFVLPIENGYGNYILSKTTIEYPKVCIVLPPPSDIENDKRQLPSKFTVFGNRELKKLRQEGGEKRTREEDKPIHIKYALDGANLTVNTIMFNDNAPVNINNAIEYFNGSFTKPESLPAKDDIIKFLNSDFPPFNPGIACKTFVINNPSLKFDSISSQPHGLHAICGYVCNDTFYAVNSWDNDNTPFKFNWLDAINTNSTLLRIQKIRVKGIINVYVLIMQPKYVHEQILFYVRDDLIPPPPSLAYGGKRRYHTHRKAFSHALPTSARAIQHSAPNKQDLPTKKGTPLIQKTLATPKKKQSTKTNVMPKQQKAASKKKPSAKKELPIQQKNAAPKKKKSAKKDKDDHKNKKQ